MKFLFLLLLINFAHAGFVSINQISQYEAEEGSTNYKRKDKCEEVEKAECLDVTGLSPKYFVVLSEMDDLGIYNGKHRAAHSPSKQITYEAAKAAEVAIETAKIESKNNALERVKIFESKAETFEELQTELKAFANDVKEVLK